MISSFLIIHASFLSYTRLSCDSFSSFILLQTETLRKQGNRLRQENEDLAKEVEQLQADRCSDVEELVYLRWVNACLRYEMRNFQPPHGKTVARDLSKSLSPRSEMKAKQLILEFANTEGMAEKGINIMEFEPDHWSSSQASYITDAGELDDPLSPKTSHSGKTKMFHKLRKLLLGKETHNHSHGSSGDRTGVTGDFDSPNGSLSVSTPTDATVICNLLEVKLHPSIHPGIRLDIPWISKESAGVWRTVRDLGR